MSLSLLSAQVWTGGWTLIFRDPLPSTGSGSTLTLAQHSVTIVGHYYTASCTRACSARVGYWLLWFCLGWSM